MKDFVTYEQALELAKLNFNEKCFGYYGLENELYIEISCNLDSNLTRRNFIAAPTFSQAFRWFREKGYYFEIVTIEVNKEYELSTLNELKNGFKTYEEAELACLQKLIEIVKTKNI